MWELPEEVWQYMEPLIPAKAGVTEKGGRPPLCPKKIAEGIFMSWPLDASGKLFLKNSVQGLLYTGIFKNGKQQAFLYPYGRRD